MKLLHLDSSKKIPRLFLSFPLALLSVIAFAAANLGLSIWLLPCSIREPLANMVKQPLLLVFNFLPILIIGLFAYFVSGRVWISYTVMTAVVYITGVINRYKIIFREDPFMPTDIILGAEAANIASSYTFETVVIAMGVFLIIVGVLVGLFVRSTKIGWKACVAVCATMVICGFGSWQFIYKNRNLYNTFTVRGSEYNATVVYESRGFVYSFLVDFNLLDYSEPDGYDDAAAAALIAEYDDETTAGKQYPHVIAVMSEAFLDVTKIDAIQFVDGFDPVDNINRLRQDGYYGESVMPATGGGTCNSEFDFLTGHNTYSISGSLPSAYKTIIRHNTDSIVWRFKDAGYTTEALHPYYSYFYNRNNVYRYLGFDDFISVEDLPEIDPTGPFTEDAYTGNKIIELFEDHLAASSDPYFNFTITIQNHGSYPDYDIGRPQCIEQGALDDSDYYTLNNYIYNLNDADEMLGMLADYASNSDEPFVIVFFGDHIPSLGAARKVYNDLGYIMGAESGTAEGNMEVFTTNFLVWSNDAADELLANNGDGIPTEYAGKLSIGYLGARLLHFIGVPAGGYLNFVNETSYELPVLMNYFMMTPGGYSTVDVVSDWDCYKNYRNLQYYKLMDERIR